MKKLIIILILLAVGTASAAVIRNATIRDAVIRAEKDPDPVRVLSDPFPWTWPMKWKAYDPDGNVIEEE